MATCLTCFAEVPSSLLPKCVVHSCCSRPVCPTCLLGMPRLATFCPFCENVQHAFRKGQRSDVIRAGQVVFDFDRVADDAIGEDLPAYEEKASNDQSSRFVLEDDEEENRAPNSKIRTPQLLQSSRLGRKQDPVDAKIDKSKPAMMAPDTAIKAQPTVDSLRQSLASGSGGPSMSRQRSKDSPDDTDSSTLSLRNHIAPSKIITSDSGLTRQYWLRPNDTLNSLCLRFRVNAANVCKLNDLPLSTATTTPHLIHTRQFLLIPEGAIQSALSSTGDAQDLQSALDGPVAQTKRQKIQRARREAQSKFRAIIAKNDSLTKGKGLADNGDVTLCDDRAAKAYISLMEAELRCIDFGDGDQSEEQSEGKKDEKLEEMDAIIEAGRRERYDTIVKQAICRWEMDSDWERQQRAMGLTPIEGVAMPTLSTPTTSKTGNWFQKLTSAPHHDAIRINLPEKKSLYVS